MGDFAKRALSAMGQAALDGVADGIRETGSQLRSEGAMTQEREDRRIAAAMLAEAGVDEQNMLRLFNRYWNTSSEEGMELIRTGQSDRLLRYMYDLGLHGAKAHYFMRLSDASNAFRDSAFRKLKVEKQYIKLLEEACRNGWDE